MNFFYIVFLLLKITIIHTKKDNSEEKEEKKSNLFEDEIKNDNNKIIYESKYIVEDEIKKIFNINPPYIIPIYISVNDLTNPNILNISNDRETYLNSYNNLLGASDKFIINSKKSKENKFIKVFLNGTNLVVNNSQLNEMIIKKIEIEKNNYNILLYFLRNRYTSQYNSINRNNIKLFKFYDENIIFYKNEEQFHLNYNLTDNNNTNNNKLFIKQKLEKNETMNQKIEEVINNYINYFKDDSISPISIILKNKISMWLTIRSYFEELLNLKQTKVNLYNFMIVKQIQLIKSKIIEIEKKIITLEYFSVDYRNNINSDKLKEKIKDLIEYLQKFDVSQSDYKIDIYFILITIIAILIVAFLCFQIYKEINFAFHKKIK